MRKESILNIVYNIYMLDYDIEFKNSFEGVLKASKAKVNIGVNEGEVLPYELLFGALASCLYATFLDIVKKKKIAFDSCTVHVTGEKRTTIPMTLEWVKVEFNIQSAKELEQKEKAFIKSVELATKYCSIYQTVASVAAMEYKINFIEGE